MPALVTDAVGEPRRAGFGFDVGNLPVIQAARSLPEARGGGESTINNAFQAVLPTARGLLPGMYARLQEPAGERSRPLVPADRVARVDQLDVVWVVAAGGRQAPHRAPGAAGGGRYAGGAVRPGQ